MKLFDIANRFKPPLNFNRNNFHNLASKFHVQDKNVTTTRQDALSHKSSWIQQKMMVVVCQPTKSPAPPDLGQMMVGNKEPPMTRNFGGTNHFRRGLVQENLMVLVCNPTWCPPPLDLGYCVKAPTNVKRDEVFDLLGMGSFGDVLPAVQSTSLHEEQNILSLDQLNVARYLRPSILFEPGLFSPSCSPREVVLCQNQSTLSIGSSPRDPSIGVTPPNLLPIVATQVTSGVSNPDTFKSLNSSPYSDKSLFAAGSLQERSTIPVPQSASLSRRSLFKDSTRTRSCVPFLQKSISLTLETAPRNISAAVSSVQPISVPAMPTRLFATQRSVHSPSASIPASPASLVAAAADLIMATQVTSGADSLDISKSLNSSPYSDKSLFAAAGSLQERSPIPVPQSASLSRRSLFDNSTRTRSCVPFLQKSVFLTLETTPRNIPAAVSSVHPISVPAMPTRLFATQRSVHSPSASIPASPASLVAAAADLLAMAPALTFSSGSSLEEVRFTGGQASSIPIFLSHVSETAIIPLPLTQISPMLPPNRSHLMTVNMVSVTSASDRRLNVSIVRGVVCETAIIPRPPTPGSPMLPPNRSYLMTVSMVSVTSASERRLNISIVETIESPVQRLQNNSGISVAMAASPIPQTAQENGIEAELLALMDSDEEPSPVNRFPLNTRRPLYMVAPPPQCHYMGTQPPQETTINPYDGDVHLFGESHYNYRVIGQRIETIDVHIDILSCLHFLFQTNPATGMVNVIGSGMFGSVFTATHLPTGQTVAIKSQFYALEDGHKIISEARIMQLLSDTGYVPKLYGMLPDPTDQRKLLIVMELIGSGITLRQKLQENMLNERQKIFLALRLTVGLHAIHDKNVLLNDIKDDNIIVFSYPGSDIHAKYIDFGHASCGFVKRYGGNGFTNARCTHLAPEVREGSPTTRASDIFGLGYTIALFRVTKLAEVVDQCMCPDPGQRPCTAILSQTIMNLL